MCPMCVASTILAVAGVASAGGVAAFAAKRKRRQEPNEKPPVRPNDEESTR